MTTEIAKTEKIDTSVMEKVLLAGDLSKMDPKDRIQYYLKTCESVGMNPMTKPFDLITLNGKMVLYVNRSGTDQLRMNGQVSIQVVEKFFDKDTGCFTVIARATLPNGRTDEDMGSVACGGLKGEALANVQMKAMTKAKRRVTLSIMGLGWIEESEVGSIQGAKLHKMDLDTGNVIDVEGAKAPHPPVTPIRPKPSVDPKPTPVIQPDIAAAQRAAEGHKINEIKKQLELTREEVEAEIYRLHKTDDMTSLSLEQIIEVREVLEAELHLRDNPPIQAPVGDQPWLQDL